MNRSPQHCRNGYNVSKSCTPPVFGWEEVMKAQLLRIPQLSHLHCPSPLSSRSFRSCWQPVHLWTCEMKMARCPSTTAVQAVRCTPFTHPTPPCHELRVTRPHPTLPHRLRWNRRAAAASRRGKEPATVSAVGGGRGWGHGTCVPRSASWHSEMRQAVGGRGGCSRSIMRAEGVTLK